MSKEDLKIELIKILKLNEDESCNEKKIVDYDSLQALEVAVSFDKHLGLQPSMNEILNCKSLEMFMSLSE